MSEVEPPLVAVILSSLAASAHVQKFDPDLNGPECRKVRHFCRFERSKGEFPPFVAQSQEKLGALQKMD
jgi:hypothetical protein